MSDLIDSTIKFEATNEAIWKKASILLESLDISDDDSSVMSFLLEQFHLVIRSKFGRRYNKHVLILAAEILNISPAAYRMLRRSRVIILPSERLIRKLLSNSFQDNDLGKIFEKLKPEQRLVNVLFDITKIKNKNPEKKSEISEFSLVARVRWKRRPHTRITPMYSYCMGRFWVASTRGC